MKTISRSTTIASIKKIKIKKRSNKNYIFPDKNKKKTYRWEQDQQKRKLPKVKTYINRFIKKNTQMTLKSRKGRLQNAVSSNQEPDARIRWKRSQIW